MRSLRAWIEAGITKARFTLGDDNRHAALIRLTLAALVGLAGFSISYFELVSKNFAAADFELPRRAAQILLHAGNPYLDIPFGASYPYNFLFYYPITAVIVAIPFSYLASPYMAGALFFGLSSALMMYGILATRHWRCLPVFGSAAYFIAASVAQWTPLIFAASLLPALSFLLTCKPNIGIIGFFYRPAWKKIIWIGIALLVGFIVFPGWAVFWYHNIIKSQSHIPPFLVLPFGPILLLSFFMWRKPEGRLLFAYSVIPIVPWFYDPLLLWLLPQTLTGSLALTGSSWVAYGLWKTGITHLGVIDLVVDMIFLPALVILALEALVAHQRIKKGSLGRTES